VNGQDIVDSLYLSGIGPAAWSELTWTIIAAYVFVHASLLCLERWRDRSSLKTDTTFEEYGPRDLTNRMNIALMLFLVILSLWFIVIGFFAIRVYPTTRHLTLYSFIVQSFFLFFDLVMAGVLHYYWVTYRRLREYYYTHPIAVHRHTTQEGEDHAQ
jgi:hypothetical protein